MTDENMAQRHRHGKVWCDLDGNIITPLQAREWGWILGGLAVLVAVLVLLILIVRSATE